MRTLGLPPSNDPIDCGCLTLATGLAVILGSNALYQSCTIDEYTCATVERVENVILGRGEYAESKYLVFTDYGVFENSDSLFHWKFDSSDFHGQLAHGGTFDLTTYGWRVPCRSMYPNIIEATPNDQCDR